MTDTSATGIGFLGAGRMATALAAGWIRAGLLRPEHCQASDPSESARKAFLAETGCQTGADNRAVVAASDLLILAVKPQAMTPLLEEIGPVIGPRHLVLSVAAGITLEQLSRGLNGHARIVRIMPNTPCLVGASASGYSPAPGVSADDRERVDRLFNSVGRAFHLPETLLDAVTGLSGSGPAFVYLVIEALADGGVNVGLPRDVATILAAQTVLGAAKMVLETGQHPEALKDMVASPGGSTIAGLFSLERAATRAAFIEAVTNATARAKELGRVHHVSESTAKP